MEVKAEYVIDELVNQFTRENAALRRELAIVKGQLRELQEEEDDD